MILYADLLVGILTDLTAVSEMTSSNKEQGLLKLNTSTGKNRCVSQWQRGEGTTI